MIDLHAHILPDIDDGPSNWEEALDTVRVAAENGTEQIVSTSHMLPDGPYANTRENVLPLVEQLKDRVAEVGIPIEIHAGGEVYLMPNTAERVQNGHVLTYCDAKKYILVELPASEIPDYTEQALFDLQLLGVTPIIAHPERNRGVMRDVERLFRLIERGVLTQVTASSLRAKPFHETAKLLLTHGAAHFVATDTHGVNRRPPTLNGYRQLLVDCVGEAEAERLLVTNPKCVIKGEPVEAGELRPLHQQSQSQGLIRRLFRSRR